MDYHLVLHVDTDQAAAWTQGEVIERWHRLFSLPVLVERHLRGQLSTNAELNKVDEILTEWRKRLMDIS